ncbi:hypothetical protein B0H13DRAFT_1951071, partial [Mycena leptocephala]
MIILLTYSSPFSMQWLSRRSTTLPTTDRARRSQARQGRMQNPVIQRNTGRKRRSPNSSQTGDRNRPRTESSIESSALLFRKEAAKALMERYAAGDASQRRRTTSPPKERRRSPLVPHVRKGRSFPLSSRGLTAAQTPEPNPYSNIWRTLYQIRLWKFKHCEPLWDLNEVFPPTEFTPRGTPTDPSRRAQWAGIWGPRPAAVTLSSSNCTVELDSSENVFYHLREDPFLKQAVHEKFGEALIMARRLVAARELRTTRIVPWSALEQAKFPVLLLSYGGDLRRVAVQLPNKTTMQVMVYFVDHCKELELMDIAQHISAQLTKTGHGRTPTVVV